MANTHELKPCPFCDGAPRIVQPHQSDRSIEGETDDEEWLSFIECDCVDMFFVKGSATSQDEARQSVVTAWNRRPALSAAQAQPVAYNDAHRHAVALRQCSLFASDVGEYIVKAMVDAADFLDRAAAAESRVRDLEDRLAKAAEALEKLQKASADFHDAACAHFSDSTYDSDWVLANAEAELSVSALPAARKALSTVEAKEHD